MNNDFLASGTFLTPDQNPTSTKITAGSGIDPNTKESRKTRSKRPFGSIRCRACNHYGITSTCPCSPSAQYSVVIQSKLISKKRRGEVRRVAFATVQEAEAFRAKIAEECFSRSNPELRSGPLFPARHDLKRSVHPLMNNQPFSRRKLNEDATSANNVAPHPLLAATRSIQNAQSWFSAPGTEGKIDFSIGMGSRNAGLQAQHQFPMRSHRMPAFEMNSNRPAAFPHSFGSNNGGFNSTSGFSNHGLSAMHLNAALGNRQMPFISSDMPVGKDNYDLQMAENTLIACLKTLRDSRQSKGRSMQPVNSGSHSFVL